MLYFTTSDATKHPGGRRVGVVAAIAYSRDTLCFASPTKLRLHSFLVDNDT